MAASAMRARVYRWWFLSQVLSASGTMTQAVAQSWLVLRLTGSAFLLALTAAATFAPALVAGAWTGSVVDRFDRRRILIFTQAIFFLLSTALGLLVAMGAIAVWMVFLFAFAAGVVGALDAPARQVFVLDLVGQENVASAVGMNEIVLNASRVLGPSLGGALLATAGVAVCFLVNAASFLPPLAVVIVLVHRRGWGPAASRGEPRPARHVRRGLAYAWRHPAIRSCIFSAIAGGMLFNMGSTLPLMATRVFHAGPQGFGIMMAAFGGGALVGALMAGSGSAWPRGRLVRVLVLATGAEVVLTAMSPWLGLLYVGLALAGMLSIWFIALANALVQLRSDPSMRGRVMGVWTMALPGMTPVTTLLIGAVATWGGRAAGAREAFGLAGAALILSAALGWRALGDRDPSALATLGASAPAAAPAGAVRT